MASIQGTILTSIQELLIEESELYVQKETNRILSEINLKYPNQYATFSYQQYFFQADNPAGFKNYRCESSTQEWYDEIVALTNIQKQTIDDKASIGFALFDVLKTAPTLEAFLSIVPRHIFEGPIGEKLNKKMNQIGKNQFRGMKPLAVIKKYINSYDPIRTHNNFNRFLKKHKKSIEVMQTYTVQHIVIR